jgi:uncharacterized protein (TIGR02246 family)
MGELTQTITQDEVKIKALYQRLIDSWGDAATYAHCFSVDADYIVANGMIEKGWPEIVKGHEFIFSTWARDTKLAGRVDSVRFLTPDVALVIAYGHVVFNEANDDGTTERTIYSLIAQKKQDEWVFVSYQNTPLVAH